MDHFRKLIPIIIVLMLIIGLPVISYYYLKSGYLFRKDALENMQLNIAFPFDDLAIPSDVYDNMNRRVKLVHFIDNQVSNTELAQLNEVQDLFDESEKFAVLSLGRFDTPDSDLQKEINNSNNWYYKASPVYLDSLSVFSKDKLLLVDTAGIGRAQYAFNERELGELVQHITVLFPLKKRSKIKLEREQNN